MNALKQVWALLDVEWWRVARAVLLGALTMVCAIGLTAVSAWLIARASQMPPILTLSVAVVGVRAFGVGRGVARYAERLASHDAALRGMANLRANLYDRLASTQLHVTAGAPLFQLRRGELLHRVGADVDEVGNLIVRAVVPAAVAAVVGLGSVALLAMMLPAAGLALLLGLLAAGVLAPWLAYRGTASAEANLAVAQAQVSAQTLQILEDGQQLRVAGRLASAQFTLSNADTALARAEAASANRLGMAHAVGVLAQSLTVIVALVLGARALAPGGWLALLPPYAADFGSGLSGRVLLAVIVITPMAVFEATAGLPGAAVQFRRSQVAAGRLSQLIGSPDFYHSEFSGHRDSASASLRSLRRMTNEEAQITLNNVEIGWAGSPEPLLGPFEFTVPAGQTLAIVGPSGIGKSTLLMTIAGLIPPWAGQVKRSGNALYIGEDDHVFATTVLENLRVAKGDATEAEATQALTSVGLVAWLAALPDGLNTELGTDATNISGGERRRLLAARALLSPAQILLLDEPAEHLDAATADAEVAALIDHVKQTGRILIIATHRSAEAERCDETLTISDCL